MKLISWNVNGLRAILRKDFMATFNTLDADFFAIQETKMQVGQAQVETTGYEQYFNDAKRKGYSGTAIFAKQHPLNVIKGIGVPEFDQEGRVLTLEYPRFFLVTSYVPNSQTELKRLHFRRAWNNAFKTFLSQLDQQKPVIICGDLNVAHKEIDIKNPQRNHHNPGFSNEEREDFSVLLANGFVDSFRSLHPTTSTYSWWSYRFHARERNAGWRIDYFLVSKRIVSKIKRATILTQITGSDHCPIELDLDL